MGITSACTVSYLRFSYRSSAALRVRVRIRKNSSIICPLIPTVRLPLNSMETHSHAIDKNVLQGSAVSHPHSSQLEIVGTPTDCCFSTSTGDRRGGCAFSPVAVRWLICNAVCSRSARNTRRAVVRTYQRIRSLLLFPHGVYGEPLSHDL